MFISHAHPRDFVLGPKTPAPATQATFLLVLGLCTALYSLPKLMFQNGVLQGKMEQLYIQSHISGTKSVNTKPFCAGIQALIPEYQVWKSP